MKLLIESFTDLLNYTSSSVKAEAYALNQNPEYIAGLNDQSVILHFKTGSSGEWIKRTLQFMKNVTDYDEITFHIWSRGKGKSSRYDLLSDFNYFMEFDNSGKKYYIPIRETFTDITFDISDLTNISSIKITCLHDDEDYLIISSMYAVRDELPVDIFRSVKEQLEYDLQSLYPKLDQGFSSGILLGSIAGSVNDKSISFGSSLSVAEKYSVILIADQTHSEKHQIDHNDGLEFFFNTKYDGSKLKYNYTSGSVYLIIPVEYGLQGDEIILPGISITGLNPEEMININKLDHVKDTFREDESVQQRKSDSNFQYLIMIDCEARTNGMIAFMSTLVRYFLARMVLWVNGKKIEIKPEGTSNFIEQTEGVNQIPKIQYIMAITIKEEVWNREKLYKTLTNNIEYFIRSN